MKGLLTSLITVLTFTGLQAQSLPTLCGISGKSTIKSVKTTKFSVKYQHFFPFRTQ